MSKSIIPAHPGFFQLVVYYEDRTNDYFSKKHPIIAWLIRTEGIFNEDIVLVDPITENGELEEADNELNRAILHPDGRVSEFDAAPYDNEAIWIEKVITEHKVRKANKKA